MILGIPYTVPFELELTSIINQILMSSNYRYREQMIKNVEDLMKAVRFLVLVGIKKLDSKFDNQYGDDFIDLFNKAVSIEPIRFETIKYIKKTNLESYLTEVWGKKNDSIKMKTISFINIDRLSIQRIRTVFILDYLGYDIELYIPTKTPYGKLNQCWIDDYKEFDEFDLSVNEDLYSRMSLFLAENPTNKKGKQSNIRWMSFDSSYEFKEYCSQNEKIKYYSLDHDYINQRFDMHIFNHHGFNSEVIRFLMLILNVKSDYKKTYIEFDGLLELLNTGWIEIDNYNGINTISLLNDCKNYLRGISDIDGFNERLKKLKAFDEVNRSFENQNSNLINDNKVVEYLSNPFRVFGFNQVDKHAITIDNVIRLLRKMDEMISELNYLKDKEGYYSLTEVLDLFLKWFNNNRYLRELKKENIDIMKYISKSLFTNSEYKHEKLSTEEIIKYIAFKCGEKNSAEFCLNYVHLDSAVLHGSKRINIVDMSYRAVKKYSAKTSFPIKIFDINSLEKLSGNGNLNHRFKTILRITKSNHKNQHKYRRLQLVNLFEKFNGELRLSFIKGLEASDVECSDFLIIKKLYTEEDTKLWRNIECGSQSNKKIELLDSNEKIIDLVRKLPELSFRDLDFCRFKFFMNNIVQDYPLYYEDFHQRLCYMNICSYMKGIQLINNEPDEKFKDLQEFVLPLFPQWSSVDKRDMLYKSYSVKKRRFKQYKGIEYPIYLDKMQILWSKYLVTKKWKLKNRYYKNKIDVELVATEFAKQIDKVEFNGGKHCMYCQQLTTCVQGVHIIDRR